MFFILASTFFPTSLTHYCFKIQFIPYITKKKPWSEYSFFLSNLGLLAKIIIWNSWILYSLSFKSGWQIQSCFDTAAYLFVLWLKTISFSAFCYLLTTLVNHLLDLNIISWPTWFFIQLVLLEATSARRKHLSG